MVNLMTAAVWTSYSFKAQSLELAMIFVGILVLSILQVAIYLFIRPRQKLIAQFFGVMILCQVFNFDALSARSCGLAGLICTTAQSLLPLSHIPSLIDTRDCTNMNSLGFLNASVLCSVFWLGWALLSSHYLFAVAQVPLVGSGIIQCLFVSWASQNDQLVSSNSRSGFLAGCLQHYIMHDLILYFKQYSVRRNCQELKSTFFQSRLDTTYSSTMKRF